MLIALIYLLVSIIMTHAALLVDIFLAAAGLLIFMAFFKSAAIANGLYFISVNQATIPASPLNVIILSMTSPIFCARNCFSNFLCVYISINIATGSCTLYEASSQVTIVSDGDKVFMAVDRIQFSQVKDIFL